MLPIWRGSSQTAGACPTQTSTVDSRHGQVLGLSPQQTQLQQQGQLIDSVSSLAVFLCLCLSFGALFCRLFSPSLITRCVCVCVIRVFCCHFLSTHKLLNLLSK